jgi:hypothetical protein
LNQCGFPEGHTQGSTAAGVDSQDNWMEYDNDQVTFQDNIEEPANTILDNFLASSSHQPPTVTREDLNKMSKG